MLLIPCPYCGERDEIEFSYAGEAHIVRPSDTENMSDAEWADYLFYRKNTLGVFSEQWSHAAGCRQFFNVARNTQTNEIIKSYKIGETFEPAQTETKVDNKIANIDSANTDGAEASNDGEAS